MNSKDQEAYFLLAITHGKELRTREHGHYTVPQNFNNISRAARLTMRDFFKANFPWLAIFKLKSIIISSVYVSNNPSKNLKIR